MSPSDRTAWNEPGAVDRAARVVERCAMRVDGPADADALLDRCADARFVLLGEASHGTSEFYRWRAPMEEMTVPAAVEGSLEDVFHRAGGADQLLLTDAVDEDDRLAEPRGHRAIGVVYHPDREAGNYVPTDLPNRYDALVHLDRTTALRPLEVHPDRDSVPELFPTGL